MEQSVPTFSLDLFSLISFALAVAALLFAGFTVWLSWQLYRHARDSQERTQDAVTRIDATVTGVRSDITEIVQRAVAYWVGGTTGLETSQGSQSLDDLRAKVDELLAQAGGDPGATTERIERLLQAQQSTIARLSESLLEARARTIFPGITPTGPAVSVEQEVEENTSTVKSGKLHVTVLRSVPSVTGTGHFSPEFSDIPRVQLRVLGQPKEAAGPIYLRAGVGTSFDFNVHLSTGGGTLVSGTYALEYKATLSPKVRSVSLGDIVEAGSEAAQQGAAADEAQRVPTDDG